MGKAKIAITLDEKIVGRIDRLVRQRTFSNRSQAIEQAIEEKLSRLDRSRLAREAAKTRILNFERNSPRKGWKRIEQNGPNSKR